MTGPEPQTGGKAFGTLANELANMVIAYAKQETVVPIKLLGRYVLFGIVGALLLGIGGGLLALAAIRAGQAETGAHLRGNFTWVPYFGGVVLAGLGAAWAVSRISKGPVSK